MWIVLIDESSSMASGFQAVESLRTFRRAPRSHPATTKLDAAVLSLLVQLEEINPDAEVALVAFTSRARLLFQGAARETSRFRAAAQSLDPNNGTDIAAALLFAADLVRSGRSRLPQIVLISDGLSDQEDAVAAARACHSLSARVDMHLIDPTEEAISFAKAVTAAGGGRWEPVTSREALEIAGRGTAARERETRAAADRLTSRQAQELAAVSSRREDTQEVEFTAVFPERMAEAQRYTVIVSAHLEALGREVQASLAAEASKDYSPVVQRSQDRSRIKKGQKIRVIPRVQGVEFNPPEQLRVWREARHDLRFDAYLEGAGTAERHGTIEIQVDRLPVAFLDVTIRVASPESAGPCEIRSASMIRRAFASYSRQNSAIVNRCKEAYLALGIHLFVDRDDLLAGEPWRAVLAEVIPECDLFQLFWSHAAKDSLNVATEIQFALDRATNVGSRFIRGLYWELPMPAPPEQLAESHFHQLDLERLGLKSSERAPTFVQPAPAFPTPPPLSASVIPLSPGVDRGFLSELRATTAHAFGLVEYYTGLRYYPVPTLLVDEHVIRTVRRDVTTDFDLGTVDSCDQDHWQEVGERGLTLGVAFHVARFELGPDARWDAPVAEWYGLPAHRSEEIRAVKGYLEGMLALVRELAKHGTATAPHSNADLFGVDPKSDTRAFVAAVFSNWLDLLNWGLERHPNHIVVYQDGTRSSLTEFRERVSTLEADVLAIVDRHDSQRQRAGAQAVGLAQTYGVFLPSGNDSADQALAEWAATRDLDPRLTLPCTPRVLLCMDALAKQRDALAGTVADPDRVARSFMGSVLVHEHFHAALEAGINSEGRASAAALGAPPYDNLPVEEAVAAWLQRHAYRRAPELSSLLTAWINSGAYPDWPYAGAERAEALYKRSGLPAVRRLIAALHSGVPDLSLDELDPSALPAAT